MTAITEFLRRQKETDLPHRRAQLQKEWLDAVECLFGHIGSWLAEAQREKLIKIRPDKIKITEENLGNYTATFLVLTTARKTVKVRPIGSTIRTNLGSCLVIQHFSNSGGVVPCPLYLAIGLACPSECDNPTRPIASLMIDPLTKFRS
jgi:hypothetical protein